MFIADTKNICNSSKYAWFIPVPTKILYGAIKKKKKENTPPKYMTGIHQNNSVDFFTVNDEK